MQKFFKSKKQQNDEQQQHLATKSSANTPKEPVQLPCETKHMIQQEPKLMYEQAGCMAGDLFIISRDNVLYFYNVMTGEWTTFTITNHPDLKSWTLHRMLYFNNKLYFFGGTQYVICLVVRF